MRISVLVWVGVLICMVYLPLSAREEKKNDTKIIVQFKKSALEIIKDKYLFETINNSVPRPSRVSPIIKKQTINNLKRRVHKNNLPGIDKLEDLVVLHYNTTSESEINRILIFLNSHPMIEYAERDYKIKGAYIPDDPNYNKQWQMPRTGMEQVWEYTQGNEDVIVAVLDTGIDYTHPDLFQNIVPGYDFYNGDDDPYDDAYDSYHGTHVAGIIAGRGNNEQGIAGMAWKIKIMPLKILGGDLDGDVSYAIAAIDHAVAEGIQIINMSWGTEHYSQTLRNTIQLAWETTNTIIITAAGNGGYDYRGDNLDLDSYNYYPANFDNVNIISVASSDNSAPEEYLSDFSNFGVTHVDLAAPGTNIFSTYGQNQYTTKSGTSMAAPQVTGAAAIIKSVYPNLSSLEIISAIIENVDPFPDMTDKIKSGGRLNVYKAITSIAGTLPGNTPLPENPPVLTPDPIIDIQLMYQCIEPIENVTDIKLQLRLISREKQNIALSDIKIRYFYTKEDTSEENIEIDFSTIQSTYITTSAENGYFEIGFTQDAGYIIDTEQVDLQLRVHTIDYTTYDQSNDYSYDPSLNNNLAYYQKIPLYVNGERIWGYGPDDPTPSPTPVRVPQPTPTPLLGDVNHDSVRDITDGLLVAQYYVGLDPQGFYGNSADVDCNSVIDIIDALLIAQYYVGLIDGFC